MSKEELRARRDYLLEAIAQKKLEQEAFNNHPSSPYRGSYGAPPYGRYHRGGRGGYGSRQLVNKPSQPATATPSPTPPHLAPQTFATSNTRQMMTKNVFDREKQQRERRAAKNVRRKNDERARLRAGEEVVVEGIKFLLRPDRSKLIRQHDASTRSLPTPKIVTHAGVKFCRTKNGNLIQANAITSLTRANTNRPRPQCEHFTKHGTCPFGRACHFTHDPEKVAICPAYLKGSCSAGDYCDLSHVISYNRVSSCIHFLRGNCNNDACRYPHVFVPPSAPVCPSFARLGYCANNDCSKRHVFECPGNNTVAGCTDPNCQLPHPDRAHVLRKVAARQDKIDSEEASDVSSDEDEQQNHSGFDDIDSDEAEDVMMGDVTDDNEGHELTQQADFVSFS